MWSETWSSWIYFSYRGGKMGITDEKGCYVSDGRDFLSVRIEVSAIVLGNALLLESQTERKAELPDAVAIGAEGGPSRTGHIVYASNVAGVYDIDPIVGIEGYGSEDTELPDARTIRFDAIG